MKRNLFLSSDDCYKHLLSDKAFQSERLSHCLRLKADKTELIWVSIRMYGLHRYVYTHLTSRFTYSEEYFSKISQLL